MSVTIRSECAHCARPLRLEIDSTLATRVEPGANPLAFLPLVDLQKLEDPSIIHAF